MIWKVLFCSSRFHLDCPQFWERSQIPSARTQFMLWRYGMYLLKIYLRMIALRLTGRYWHKFIMLMVGGTYECKQMYQYFLCFFYRCLCLAWIFWCMTMGRVAPCKFKTNSDCTTLVYAFTNTCQLVIDQKTERT